MVDHGASYPPSRLVQVVRAQTDTTGLYTWTFLKAFDTGVVPVIQVVCEGPNPQAGVTVNAQVEGSPTNTSCSIRVTKVNSSVVALLGLTILSLPASVGATSVHIVAFNP